MTSPVTGRRKEDLGGPAPGSGFRSSLPLLRLVTLLALLSIVPLATLTYSIIHLAGQAVIREVNARVRATSDVAGVLLDEEMNGVAELTASYATRPLLIKAVADGVPAHYDPDEVARQLRQLQGAQRGNGGVFLTDPDCHLTQVEPATPSIVGLDFGFRDWCQGVRRTGLPYISEAYRSVITGNPLVVAVATMVRSTTEPDAGRPLAILAVVYKLDTISAFADQLSRAQGIHLTVTDQRGTVVVGRGDHVGAGGLATATDDARVTEALAGRSGLARLTTKEGDMLSAFAPVPGLGWTVTANVPAHQALAGVRRLRSAVLSIAGALALVLMAGIALLARALRLRREADKKVVKREAYTRAILQAATDAFVSIDAGGRINAWNQQAQEVFGWSEGDAIGRNAFEAIVPSRFRNDLRQELAGVLAPGAGPILSQRRELLMQDRNGREFLAEVAVSPLQTQGGWTLNAFVHDISQRKQAEAELAEARDEAVAASHMKSEFLANMSHEIRTPMNGVLGMTSLLLGTRLQREQHEFAETVLASGEALLEILNDILDFSKIEAGRLDLECIDFDLRAMVEGVVTLLGPAAHQKGLEMACSLPDDLPQTVRGDPGRLRQILTNLIGNGVKFTESGEVLLEVTCGAREGGGVLIRFEVSDTGIGIAGDDQAAMFESFSQADASTTRRYGGTGLGLAISRQLVHLMDGEIGVRSELGHGSCFWCAIPFSAVGSALPDALRAELAGLRMLVVDDNATNRAILTRFLQAWGVQAESAEGATSALVAVAASEADGHPFDAFLLDLNMPDIDGIELARRIGRETAPRPARIVLLTSTMLGGELAAAQEAGIARCLAKPVRQAQLYDCLATVMGAPEAAAPGPAVESPPSSPDAPLRRILLAEDNLVNQRVGVAMLRKLGFDVDVVSNGAEAVEAAASSPYEAILIDCQMPVMDGYEATTEIRRREGSTARTPVIAVTASAMKSDEDRCRAAGMDDYLTKPLSLKALDALLARWTAEGPTAGEGDGLAPSSSGPPLLTERR